LTVAIKGESGAVWMGDGENGSTARCFRMLSPHRVYPPSYLLKQIHSVAYIHGSEYLRLPKSTLQTQVAHGAKSDLESDFNFETEYLLDCSIPNKPPGEAIFLQECLADYFTNIVQVRRKLVIPAEERPSLNYSTKPFYSPTSWSSSSGSGPGGDELPPYMGDGNGFYGAEKKKSYSQVQERNVAAWQVSLLIFLPSSSPFICFPLSFSSCF
jgi:hypothetical protein